MKMQMNYFFLLQDDDNDLRSTFLKSKIILVKSKFFRFFFCRFLLEQFYIPFLCYKYKINILHSLHYSFPIFLFKVKRIVTIHDLTFFYTSKCSHIYKNGITLDYL